MSRLGRQRKRKQKRLKIGMRDPVHPPHVTVAGAGAGASQPELTQGTKGKGAPASGKTDPGQEALTKDWAVDNLATMGRSRGGSRKSIKQAGRQASR